MSAEQANLLSVRDLTIAFSRDANVDPVLHSVSFDLRRGETLAIVGESGSGKSVTAMSLMQLLPKETAVIRRGSAMFDGRDLLTLDEDAINRVRGAAISMIFQEPMTSLNPVLTVGLQLTEVITEHQGLSPQKARDKALDMLRRVRISDPEKRLAQYPHQLSGGMRQRVMIAMALACRPRILIADEPTTALDVTIQAEILELLRELKREFDASIILITHDMGVVAEMADRVIVMNGGRIVEEADVDTLFAAPSEPYTRALLQAVPRLGELADATGPIRFKLPGDEQDAAKAALPPRRGRDPVLSVQNLDVRFDVREGLFRRLTGRVHAVEGVSFDIAPGETLALVGESGCGKSSTGRAIIRLEHVSSGDIWIDGRNVAQFSRAEMTPVRKMVQMVFQDPYASLNPRLEAGSQVREPLVIHGVGSAKERDERTADLFRRVGLTPEMRKRYPHQFSGGQRQRLCIARALSLNPKLIIADEAVSALDVSIQAQVINLMLDIQAEYGLSYLFISHDMAVVERVAHRVAVMRMGRIVEIGPRAAVLADPRHPYTKRLLSAVPIADPVKARARKSMRAEGEIASPLRPLGYAAAPSPMSEVAPGHFVAIDG